MISAIRSLHACSSRLPAAYSCCRLASSRLITPPHITAIGHAPKFTALPLAALPQLTPACGMARPRKVAKLRSEVAAASISAVSSVSSKSVRTAATAIVVAEEVDVDSSSDFSAAEEVVEELLVVKKEAVQKVEAQPPQPPAPFDPAAPLPNLGYACLNVTLRNDGKKPSVFNNRTCRLATLKQKGLEFVSGLALQNCKDLLPILRWNAAHGIKLFRLSSEFFPWGNVHYKLSELSDYEAIKEALAAAGAYARETGQRLTSHPSEFTKLAGQTEALVASSIADLELHSEMFDLLGFEPSPFNKINIHIGGTYGDKEETLRRWAKNFRRLSPSCQARVTVENDDRASMFSVADLLTLHEELKPHVPIVFDFHHWRFCTGGMTSEEAFKAAIGTWPPGVRPVVHWSESQGGKRPHAHSDYIGQQGRLNLHGMDAHVDVMIESKAKELSLLLYRDIAKNGNANREVFFQGVDAIEEEAARVEAAREAGEAVELEPLPGLELEGTEIIPVNDKRLHGRSQRRNKAQVAARAASAKLAAGQQSQGEDADAKPAKRKRRSKEEIEAEKAQKTAAKAEREAAKAEKAAANEAAASEKAAAKEVGKAEKVAAKAAAAAEKQAAAAGKAAAKAASAELAGPATPARKPAKGQKQAMEVVAAASAAVAAVGGTPKKAVKQASVAKKAAAAETLAVPDTPQPASGGKRRRVK